MKPVSWDYPSATNNWLGCHDPIAYRHWVVLRQRQTGGLEIASGIERSTILEITASGRIIQGDYYEL